MLDLNFAIIAAHSRSAARPSLAAGRGTLAAIAAST
jgi:hypothetical protein